MMYPLLKKLKARVLGASQAAPSSSGSRYEGDGMAIRGRNLSWMRDAKFTEAYQAGIQSGHQWGKDPSQPLHVEWRVHMALWAANHALQLPGDFVECGVNTGILSLAICRYLDFGNRDRKMYLFDTYAGTPESQMSANERASRVQENKIYYPDCYEQTQRNFAPYPNVTLVRGEVPATLNQVSIDRVAYLSLDMNIALPERAALEFFWDRLSPGAVVLMDDYAWKGFEEQTRAMDEFAAQRQLMIASLPTGQGLLIKP